MMKIVTKTEKRRAPCRFSVTRERENTEHGTQARNTVFFSHEVTRRYTKKKDAADRPGNHANHGNPVNHGSD